MRRRRPRWRRSASGLEGLQGRVSGIEGAENPFAEISDQLTRLYAQKDATVETVFARLGPLEAKLAAVEGQLAARDPQTALERFAERLEAARAAQEAAVAALGDREGRRAGCPRWKARRTRSRRSRIS